MVQRELSSQVHGSCVEIDGRGALFVGKSGSGKSGLALDLISRGARLVGDDQITLSISDGRVVATAARIMNAAESSSFPNLVETSTASGRIEARLFGILETPATEQTNLRLVVDLDQPEHRRLPSARSIVFNSVRLPLLYGRNVPNLAAAICVFLRSDCHLNVK